MRKKLLLAAVVLALVASGYTAYAYFATRGVAVYLLGTQRGAVLAGSWQGTLLLAVVLWIPGAVALVRKLRGRGKAPAPAAGVTVSPAATAPATARIPPRKGTTQPPVSAAAAPAPAGKPAAGYDPTAVLPRPEGTPAAPAPESTEGPPPDRNGAPGAAAPARTEEPAAQPAEPLRFCPMCGSRIAGGRFCERCGAKLRD